jgi:hypothetical protein
VKSNPLATRYVAPGRLEWQPQNGQSLADIVSRFTHQLGCRAAIVGPHGSGKSTLLEHLVPRIGPLELRKSTYGVHDEHGSNHAPSSSGRSVVWLKLRGSTASRRLLLETRHRWARRGGVLILDGYEQLSRATRGLALALTRARGAGLLVTSHRATWLPTLVETKVDVSLAQILLDQLLPVDEVDRDRLVDPQRLGDLLRKHQGNLREVFMELYDDLEP